MWASSGSGVGRIVREMALSLAEYRGKYGATASKLAVMFPICSYREGSSE